MFVRKLLVVVVLFASVALVRAAGDAVSFGFSGPETFPIDPQISSLHAADMDGDGLMDLIVVNNSHARINILFNQTGKTNLALATRASGKLEQNELPQMRASASTRWPRRNALPRWP